ncbi:M13 family metallopeptidase [Archangium sp.]|uniref:M13 family metallopeptidase n=1 Tax=Archangium sp. TaxID=1872627 RepID=UPI00389A6893
MNPTLGRGLSLAGLAVLLSASAPARAEETKAAAPATLPEKPYTALPYSPSLDFSDMDRSVEPCVDFYTYSCGGWIKNNPIPEDRPRWSVYGKLHQDNLRFLWGVLEEAAKPSKARAANDQRIGDYFSSCMDEAAIDKKGAQPLQADLAAIDHLPSPKELAALLGRLHLSAASNGMLFGSGSAQDYGDSSRVIAFTFAGGLGLPDRDYYTKTDARSEDIRKRYVAYVTQVLQLLGEPPQDAQAHAQQVMELETAFAQVSLTRVEKRDPHNLHHLMKLEELQAMTPHFDWTAYFKALGIPSTPEVNVTEPAFFKELDARLEKTPLPVLKTYLRWHLVRGTSPYLARTFADPSFDFYSKYLRGVAARPPRWKQCVEWVDRDLGEALGQAFVKKTFGPQVKARTVDMTQRIEKAMEDDIRSLDWMSEQTKQAALEKLRAIRNKVGYPEKWRDYSKLQVARGDFTGNVSRSLVFESRRQLAKIGKPLDRGEWGMTPPTVNAYYDPQMNDINFPAGVLQPPLFDFKLDDAPNYGNTGSTIGHELTHGFDDEGRQFDARGNLRDWWTPHDAAEFESRAKCVSDQYAQYTVVDDIKINSKLTLGEDVADLGGTVLAYIAWKKAVETQKLEDQDGFTPDQRFFIGLAQWACESERPESARLNAITNPHSPGRYRINGVVSNMPEFRAAFSCKAGQPMVREQACRVW